jgi:hypothetical protein
MQALPGTPVRAGDVVAVDVVNDVDSVRFFIDSLKHLFFKTFTRTDGETKLF